MLAALCVGVVPGYVGDGRTTPALVVFAISECIWVVMSLATAPDGCPAVVGVDVPRALIRCATMATIRARR